MILSVVIVSYNVKFFLEQCLSSLKKAIEGSLALSPHLQTEVFVIDNASTDGTTDFLIPLYPDFHFIRNKINVGFARANNQAVLLCSGEFILFLNPDTILAEDNLDICLSFLRSTPDAGAVGLKMIDGSGNYLRESKRGFPTPRASFFKMSGLTSLFPRSKFFSPYYMGHLNEQKPHAVDVLTGAFMFLRKKVVDLTGGFDEQFFMYAEDIDLSFRITQTGYRNYFLPQYTIIHFKGESTIKDGRYVKTFYGAMELFLKKHFENKRSTIQLLSLRLGIRLREMLAYFYLPFRRSAKPNSPLRVFVKGEPEEKNNWKLWLIKNNIPVAETQAEAEEILYCEGVNRTWKSIIEEISLTREQFVYKFHGAGTHSAVGSDSGRILGDFIEK
jgi:N-acetylglucosaminyl-diphospho-decaprenol L-rhamnosyltransferase